MSIVADSGSSLRKAVRPASLDIWLVLGFLTLLCFGLAALYSEGTRRTGTGYFGKQLTFAALGIVPLIAFWKLDYRIWRKLSVAIYVANLLLLLAVLVAGSNNGGAQRWFELGPIQFQPSEFCKIALVLTLTTFFANRIDSIQRLSTFLLSLLHVVPPLALVFIQPHLGASLVILCIWFAISLFAGVPTKFIVATILCGAGLITLAVSVPGVLKGYQMSRIVSMFENDQKGKGYQPYRAILAIGSGGVMGEGFLKGEQKQGGYIPDQHTDFIFTVVGEEGGLVGSSIVLGAFALIFYRIWLIIFAARDPTVRMMAAGVLALLGAHMLANLGMNLRLVPVVGLWLPFMSYGGTALWLCMACVGLMLNLRSNEHIELFH